MLNSKHIQFDAPEGAVEARLLQLPDYDIGWVHFFDEGGCELVSDQVALIGQHNLEDFSDGIVSLSVK